MEIAIGGDAYSQDFCVSALFQAPCVDGHDLMSARLIGFGFFIEGFRKSRPLIP